MDPQTHRTSLGRVDPSALIKDMDEEFQTLCDIQKDRCVISKMMGQGLELKRWIRQPSFLLTCGLFTLCILLLSTIIILVAASRNEWKEISASLERMMSAQLREGSVESDIQKVLSEVENLSATLKNKDGSETEDSRCSTKWKYYKGSCYYVSRKFNSWSGGQRHCEVLEAHLVVINTKEEQDQVNILTRGVGTWIGLTDVDGEWKWVDGTSYNATPTFWDDDQPDEWYGHGLGGGEDCAQIHYGDSWNDSHCSRKFQYICEKKSS